MHPVCKKKTVVYKTRSFVFVNNSILVQALLVHQLLAYSAVLLSLPSLPLHQALHLDGQDLRDLEDTLQWDMVQQVCSEEIESLEGGESFRA